MDPSSAETSLLIASAIDQVDPGDAIKVIVMLVVIVIAFFILRNVRDVIVLFWQMLLPLPATHRRWLEKHNLFYSKLGSVDRTEFRKRVKEVIYEKDWIGHDIELRSEHKVRVAAALVQLTFGLERLLLLHFRRIEVFPSAYRDRTTGRMHQGGVRPATGTISLSWEHFVKGYEDPNDALNLGLHELAHALWVENSIKNQESGFFDQGPLDRWNAAANEEIQRMRNGNGRLFRSYAATDLAEFFAVAVEYFFEQPLAFKRLMPDLYSIMVDLLKQDPASIGNTRR